MSGIGGMGRADGYVPIGNDDGGPSSPADAGGSGATEAPIVRGTIVADKVLDMSARQLEKQLRAADTGLTKAEAKAQAKEIKKTAEEIQKLEGQLKGLNETKAALEKELADPNLDPWERTWLECDLWDVQLQIYDVEEQLGKAAGNIEELLGQAWDGILGAIDLGLKYQKTESEKLDRGEKRLERRRTDGKLDREKEGRLERAREDRLKELRDKGILPPTPPASEMALKVLEQTKAKLENAQERTREVLDEARQAVRNFREKRA